MSGLPFTSHVTQRKEKYFTGRVFVVVVTTPSSLYRTCSNTGSVTGHADLTTLLTVSLQKEKDEGENVHQPVEQDNNGTPSARDRAIEIYNEMEAHRDGDYVSAVGFAKVMSKIQEIPVGERAPVVAALELMVNAPSTAQ